MDGARITAVAHTEVGPGPESSPVVVRTDEDGKAPTLGPRTPGPSPAPAAEPSASLENWAGWWSEGTNRVRGPVRSHPWPLILEFSVLWAFFWAAFSLSLGPEH